MSDELLKEIRELHQEIVYWYNKFNEEDRFGDSATAYNHCLMLFRNKDELFKIVNRGAR